jgi:stearoyl-CoA desaturase (Delta-9 desaturase)
MKNKLKEICWSVTLFLVFNPLITFSVLIPYLILSDSYTSSEVVSITIFGGVFAILTNLSITMGYHRLFSHKSYEAHPILQTFLLLIGAGAFQGSQIKTRTISIVDFGMLIWGGF